MDSDDLKPEQLDRLGGIVARDLRFMIKLVRRMERLGFAGNDPIYAAALKVQGELQGLRMAIHYAGCKSGVWRDKKG